MRLYNALRVCLATTICVLVSAWFQLPLCFESVIGVLVLFCIYNSQLLQKGAERVAGRIIGALAGLILANLFFDTRPLFILALGGFLFWGMYRFAEGKIPYASANAGFSLAAVMIVSCVSAGAASDFAFHWVLQVALGVVVAIAVDRVLPFRVAEALNTGTMEIFHACSGKLGALSRRVPGEAQTAEKDELQWDFFSQVLSFVEFRKKAKNEGPFSPDLYMRLLSHAKTLFCKIEFMENLLAGFPLKHLNQESLCSLNATFQAMAADCDEIGNAISRSLLLAQEQNNELQAYRDLEQAYAARRSAPTQDADERETRKRFGGLVGLARDIQSELSKARRIHNELLAHGADGDSGRAEECRQYAPAVKNSVDWDSVRKAAMISFTILIVFACLIYLQIPGGQDALVAGLIVGGQANLGHSFLKWRLRTAGAFIGAVYGMLAMLVIGHLPYFPVMLWLLLCGIFVASYIAGGPEGIAYGGLQAGIAVAIVLVYDPGPPVSMDAVEARFWGAVVGGFVALVVHYLFWPVDPLQRLRGQLSRIIGHCGTLFTQSVRLDAGYAAEVRHLSDLVTVDIENSLRLLKDAAHMIDGSKRGLALFERLTERLMDVVAMLSTVKHECDDVPDGHPLRVFLADLQPVTEQLGRAFDVLRDGAAGGNPLESQLNMREIEIEFRSSVEDFRKKGKTLAAGAKDVAAVAVVHDSLLRLVRDLAEISEITEAVVRFEA